MSRLEAIDARAAALRREMAALARARHRIEVTRSQRRSHSLPPSRCTPARPGADDDLAPRRAVEVVEHVLLDVIVNECAIEVEMEMEMDGFA